ncbi:MAG TPA: hypothetical protein VK048_03915 [Atopostipes sp.]|nr:hypothetical protein [Atopostipes sp.]
MNNHLNLNVLQDYVDMNGGTFRLKVKWHRGNISIEQDKEKEGAIVHFIQMPMSPKIEREMDTHILKQMPGVHKVTINKSLEVTQEVKQSNVIDLHNKFGQAMDFEIELNSNKPATVRAYTYHGVQRLEHDGTYVRALFTTNPYFAIVFNGIRIVPYQRDIEELGDTLIQTVKEYASKILSKSKDEDLAMQFKVIKAFEVSFYVDDKDVTQEIQRLMNKKKENQTSLDEFGFVAYIAFYQFFEGELNNQVPLSELIL